MQNQQIFRVKRENIEHNNRQSKRIRELNTNRVEHSNKSHPELIIQHLFYNNDMLVRPVSGSSTRVSWFPMAATHCSTEDTNPSEQSSDTPDSANSLHKRWCVRDKDNGTEVFVLFSHPAGCESAARQHSC